MRRNLKILFYASLAVLFSSCENLFKEECEAKGFLSATVSDKGPVPSTTEEIQVRYYDYHTGVEHTEKLGEPDYFALGNRFCHSWMPEHTDSSHIPVSTTKSVMQATSRQLRFMPIRQSQQNMPVRL